MSRARAALSPELGTTTALGAESVPMPESPGRSNAPGKLGRHKTNCGGLINQRFLRSGPHILLTQLMPQTRTVRDVVEAVADI